MDTVVKVFKRNLNGIWIAVLRSCIRLKDVIYSLILASEKTGL